jgi:carbon-monoxide dehydrogenase medium subunit
MKNFNFIKPTSLEEALFSLQKYTRKTRILAGGTDLLVQMKLNRYDSPEYLMSLKGLHELNYLRWDDEGLSVGALTTIRELEVSSIIRQQFPALSDAVRNLGSVQVRNLATIGGNICRASPSADLVSPLVAYGARAIIFGQMGERSVSVEEFFVGPGKTILGRGDILKGIFVPKMLSASGSAYVKYGTRKEMEIAVVATAVLLRFDKNEKCQETRIVLGAVAPTVMRARKAELVLCGQWVNDSAIEKAAEEAALEARPISDIRAGAAYRREMVRVYTRRAIRLAKQRSTGISILARS